MSKKKASKKKTKTGCVLMDAVSLLVSEALIQECVLNTGTATANTAPKAVIFQGIEMRQVGNVVLIQPRYKQGWMKDA